MKITPTPENLSRAFDRLRKAEWGTLQEALSHPIRGKLINGYACSLQREAPRIQREKLPSLVGMPVPRTPPMPLRFDCKRLASGEREDD